MGEDVLAFWAPQIPPALSAPNGAEWALLCLNSHPSAAFQFPHRNLPAISQHQQSQIMSYFSSATVHINSDWATFQLMVEEAIVEPLMGHHYPPGMKFTPNGLVFGQPNEQLQPQRISIPFGIRSPEPRITFFTGKGDGGIGGERDGLIAVQLGGNDYVNQAITGDGLNIQGFFNVPLQD